MKKITKVFTVFIFLITLTQVADLNAQCPMCSMTGQTNLREGGTQAKGLNKGILYLLATPYILMGSLGYMWWRNKKAKEELEKDSEESN